MTKPASVVALTIAALTGGSHVQAQAEHLRVETHMRAGLWEISTESPLLALVPQIPKQDQDNLRSLARQYGIDVPQIRGTQAVAQVCVTPEMARQDILPDLNQSRAGCTAFNARRQGDHYRLEVACKSDEISGNGQAEGTLTSAETFSGNSHFTGLVRGLPIDQNARTSGQWIATACTGRRAQIDGASR